MSVLSSHSSQPLLPAQQPQRLQHHSSTCWHLPALCDTGGPGLGTAPQQRQDHLLQLLPRPPGSNTHTHPRVPAPPTPPSSPPPLADPHTVPPRTLKLSFQPSHPIHTLHPSTTGSLHPPSGRNIPSRPSLPLQTLLQSPTRDGGRRSRTAPRGPQLTFPRPRPAAPPRSGPPRP